MEEAYVRVHCVVVRCRQGEAPEAPAERTYVAVIPGHWAQDPERVRRVGQIVGNHLSRLTAGDFTYAIPTRWGLVPSGEPADCQDGGGLLRIQEDESCFEHTAQGLAGT